MHHCLTCETVTAHLHLHDCPHGVAGTHLAGSERFECVACGRLTFAHSEAAHAFPFVLDGAERRRIAA